MVKKKRGVVRYSDRKQGNPSNVHEVSIPQDSAPVKISGSPAFSSLEKAIAFQLVAALKTDSVRILTVPAPPSPADSIYRISVSPLWRETSPGSYNAQNADTVLMQPRKVFTLFARYPGNTGTSTEPQEQAQAT